MKTGIILPTRGDRPKFLSQALYYIKQQTVQPDYVEVIDEKPASEIGNDITYRYQKGYEHLKNKCDAIFCIEDDDWYAKNYIEEMLFHYKRLSAPNIFGINSTIYYHIKAMKWTKLVHPGRASTMSTVLKGGQNINWQHDHRFFIDIHLWQTIKGLSIEMPIINMGIKHGEGKCAGIGHRYNWSQYQNDDMHGKYLKEITGEDYKFYKPSL